MTTTIAEKALLQRSSAYKFVWGLVLILAPFLYVAKVSTLYPGSVHEIFIGAMVCRFLGLACLGISLSELAESKGHSRCYGFMVLLGFIGMIWTVLLRDKNVDRGVIVQRVRL